MDLHAGQVQGFFNIPVDHMTALPMFAQYFRDQGLPQDRLVVVSPDAGRVKLAKKFAEMLGGDLAFINKERPGHSESRVMTLIGDVSGKVAIISDDMIDCAGTLCNAAQAVPMPAPSGCSHARRTPCSRARAGADGRPRCSSGSSSAIPSRSIR